MADFGTNDTFVTILQPCSTKYYPQQSAFPVPQNRAVSPQYYPVPGPSRKCYFAVPLPEQKNQRNDNRLTSKNCSKTDTILQMNRVSFQDFSASDRPVSVKSLSAGGSSSITATPRADKLRHQGDFQSTTVQLVPSGNYSQTKTIINPLSTRLSPESSKNLPKDKSISSSKYNMTQWLYIILAWFIAATGLSIYLYILTLAFTGKHDILSERYVLPVVTILSNFSLLSAVYFHHKIRKFLLL